MSSRNPCPWDTDRDRHALAQVVWLARSGRHTNDRDNWTTHALNKGWARLIPGLMPGWQRVALTLAGEAAIRTVGLPDARY